MPIPEQLAAIIDKYLAGTASEEEKQLLQDWYQVADQQDIVVLTPDANAEEHIEARLRQRLHAAISEMATVGMPGADAIAVKRSPLRRIVNIAAAAAVLVLLAGGYYFFLKQPSKDPAIARYPQHAQYAIVPGGNKAILTLADGSIVVLDSAHDGILARERNANIVKKNAGTISYDARQEPFSDTGAFAVEYNTLTTPRGGQYNLTLSDGSKVWLNAASSIRYPAVFDGHQRTVAITGEAYFEIAPSSGKGRGRIPFTVKINSETGDGSEVQVLGTHFNISGYADDAATKVTLLEGRIKMKTRNGEAMLVPGQQATLHEKNDAIEVVNDDDAESAIAWKEGRFEFDSDSDVKDIMRKIARWYDVDVEYEQNVTHKVFGGAVPRQSNVRDVLKMLESTGSIHFKIEGRKVTVMN